MPFPSAAYAPYTPYQFYPVDDLLTQPQPRPAENSLDQITISSRIVDSMRQVLVSADNPNAGVGELLLSSIHRPLLRKVFLRTVIEDDALLATTEIRSELLKKLIPYASDPSVVKLAVNTFKAPHFYDSLEVLEPAAKILLEAGPEQPFSIINSLYHVAGQRTSMISSPATELAMILLKQYDVCDDHQRFIQTKCFQWYSFSRAPENPWLEFSVAVKPELALRLCRDIIEGRVQPQSEQVRALRERHKIDAQEVITRPIHSSAAITALFHPVLPQMLRTFPGSIATWCVVAGCYGYLINLRQQKALIQIHNSDRDLQRLEAVEQLGKLIKKISSDESDQAYCLLQETRGVLKAASVDACQTAEVKAAASHILERFSIKLEY